MTNSYRLKLYESFNGKFEIKKVYPIKKVNKYEVFRNKLNNAKIIHKTIQKIELKSEIYIYPINFQKLLKKYPKFYALFFAQKRDFTYNFYFFRNKKSFLLKSLKIGSFIPNLKDIARKLNYNTNKLFKVKALYESLDLSESLMKYIMLKVYNMIYKNKIKSYTKDFIEFYNHRFYDNIIAKELSIKRGIKKRLITSRQKRKYKETYLRNIPFRFRNIRSSLNAQNHFNITDFSILDMLKAHIKWENQDIIKQLIAEKDSNPDNDQNIEFEIGIQNADPRGSYENRIKSAELLNLYQ